MGSEMCIRDSLNPTYMETKDDNIHVISVSSGEDRIFPPVTITCGDAQILQHIETNSIETTNTIMSLSLLLAIEQQTRPMLDYASLKAELINNPNMKQFTRESPGHRHPF